MEKKYVLTEERRKISSWYGREIELRKIVATKDFDVSILQNCKVFVGDRAYMEKRIVIKHIKEGETGGWIESESNLSQDGDAWVDKGAVVFDKAIIRDDAWVGGKKTAVAGNAVVAGNSIVFSDDRDEKHRTDVTGNIRILGFSKILSSLAGEGVVNNILIKRPTEVKPQIPRTKVKFECSVGDKKIAREYEL